ncbi:leukocyte elastase inhibitor-like protein [Leptotrombidium deliense]|uniref:Leukocyte elastase inhibitor-like protein n=1 Tax=Leptotrombidium deliense TaxID=299467 RepID=A0A443SDC2_9ACAR|nr:leukocyte elastase inhibitor-like protein [Leptotrombidium deliense]
MAKMAQMGKRNFCHDPFNTIASIAVLIAGFGSEDVKLLFEAYKLNTAFKTPKECLQAFKETDVSDIYTAVVIYLVSKKFTVSKKFHELLEYYRYAYLGEDVDFEKDAKREEKEIERFIDEIVDDSINKEFFKLFVLKPEYDLVYMSVSAYLASLQLSEKSHKYVHSVFYNHGDEKVTIRMKNIKCEMKFASFIEYTVVDINMESDEHILFIRPNSEHGLERMLAYIDYKMINETLNTLELKMVDFMHPIINVTSTRTVNSYIQDQDFSHLFSRNASLSNLVDSNEIYVSEVYQFTTVQLNSSAIASNKLYNEYENDNTDTDLKTFHLNHPFLYFIFSNNDNILLYSGYVNQIADINNFEE